MDLAHLRGKGGVRLCKWNTGCFRRKHAWGSERMNRGRGEARGRLERIREADSRSLASREKLATVRRGSVR